MKIYDIELTPKHYNILKYLYKNKHVSQEQLYAKLGFQQFHNNIPYLHTSNMIICNSSENNGTHMFVGDIYLTSLGENAFLIMRNENRKLWLKNAWIPIIVSFVTTNITIHLIPKLPQILRWLCDILSKIFLS